MVMQKFLDNERSAPWILVLMFGLAAVNWPLLPDEVPLHWSSADAAPDSLGPKSFGLLFLPVFALVQYLVFRIVPAFGSSDRRRPCADWIRFRSRGSRVALDRRGDRDLGRSPDPLLVRAVAERSRSVGAVAARCERSHIR